MDFTPFINKEQKEPIYFQIYHFLRTEMEEGRIKAGSRLPSIRQLSLHLQVSKNTVETAYAQLIAEGYVESRPKSGLWVLELEDMADARTEESRKAHISNKNKGKAILCDFQYGDIDLEKFPLKTWKRCLNQAVENPGQEIFSYGDKKGNLDLRCEIAKYLYQSRGVNCSHEQIILCSGTQQAISLLSQLMDLSEKTVGMEEPGYDGVRYVFESLKAKIFPIPLSEDGIMVDELKNSNAACAYVTPSHQFPLGMVLSIQKRMKLLQWANETGSFIIEDDYDSEFRYQGQPIPSLKSLDNGENVIYLGTFSKAFLPAARVSYLVLPEPLHRRFDEKFSFYNQAVSPIIQRALYFFMKEGHFVRHIRRMRKVYQEKHRTLLDYISLYFGCNAQIIGHKAGLHLLLELKGADPAELVTRAEKKGVKVYTTEKFWHCKGEICSRPLMLGFGGLSLKEIEEGIRLLSIAYKESREANKEKK